MSYQCPVCNGLAVQVVDCPGCGQHCEDCGRYSDSFDPYSPYREIEDLKRTNGIIDASNHQCIHLYMCASCTTSVLASIAEWHHI